MFYLVGSFISKGISPAFINVFSTLIFGWKWKLSRRTFLYVVSTLAKQRWNNIERITLIQCRWSNVVSTFIFGWKWKLNQGMLRKQYWNNFANCCTNLYWCSLESGSKTKQIINKCSRTKHIFLLYIRT